MRLFVAIRFVILLLCLLIPFTGCCSLILDKPELDSELLRFINNGSRVTLSPESDYATITEGYRHYKNVSVGDVQNRFAVLNTLIVSGTPDILGINWRELLSYKTSRVLAHFSNLVVIEITLSDWQLQSAIDKAKHQPGVKNVQPDMISLQGQKASVAKNKVQNGTFLDKAKVGVKFSDSPPVSMAISGEVPRGGVEQKPVRVALVDDGFDLSLKALTDARVVFQYDLHTGKMDASPKTNFEIHGTAVLGVLQSRKWKEVSEGLAPDAEIIALRLVSAQTSKLVLAMGLARKMSSEIINLSWRLPYLPDPLRDVLTFSSNIEPAPILVVAAGNNSQDACIDNQLALIKSAIVVGAVNRDGTIASLSNYGECVDVYGPIDINGLLPGFMHVHGIEHHIFHGTSASATWVTGRISGMLRRFDSENYANRRRLIIENLQ